ncbi:MAG: UbiA family prenyltransferase [Thaumarchaeota archaeon]|nr:UbiA family prenyltransferase [Nitrososphaerota archaeon]
MNPGVVLYRELVMGGHLLALGTSSMAAASALLLGMQPTFVLLLMAYLFSYGAYMMNRTSDIEQDEVSNPARTSHLRGRKRYLPMIVGFCFVLGYGLALLVSFVFFIALLVPLVLSVAYSVGSKRLVPLIGASRLKQKLLVKNLAISFGWSLIPFLVGLYYSELTAALLFLSPFIFMRLMVNTILFDVRDVRADGNYGVRTLPIVYGTVTSFRLMSLIDLASIFYIVTMVATSAMGFYAISLLALPLYSLIYRTTLANHQSRINLVCDFVADGEYVLWGPLLYLGKIFV